MRMLRKAGEKISILGQGILKNQDGHWYGEYGNGF